MENEELAISKQSNPFLYKSILSNELSTLLYNYYDNLPLKEFLGNLGPRYQFPIEEQFMNDIKKELYITLINYFPNLYIGDMRIYKQQFGSIDKHKDMSKDGICDMTCLIYLSEVNEGGELVLRTERPIEDLSYMPNKKFYHFKIMPKKGYGIIFQKNTIHWADEVFSNKIILLIDLANKY